MIVKSEGKIFPERQTSGCGGTGRRVRFRFLWPQGCTGSSPATRTKQKSISFWGCFFVLCRANRLGPRSFRLRNEQTLRADSSLNRALGAKSLQAPATRTKKTDSFGSVFFFYAGGDLNRKRKAFSGSRRLGNTVETRTQHSFASFLLISFGRFTKNSYQLFFPRLPATRTKRKSISFSLCILSGEIEVTKYRQRTCFLCRFVV